MATALSFFHIVVSARVLHANKMWRYSWDVTFGGRRPSVTTPRVFNLSYVLRLPSLSPQCLIRLLVPIDTPSQSEGLAFPLPRSHLRQRDSCLAISWAACGDEHEVWRATARAKLAVLVLSGIWNDRCRGCDRDARSASASPGYRGLTRAGCTPLPGFVVLSLKIKH
jgi:hypothetical protein